MKFLDFMFGIKEDNEIDTANTIREDGIFNMTDLNEYLEREELALIDRENDCNW